MRAPSVNRVRTLRTKQKTPKQSNIYETWNAVVNVFGQLPIGFPRVYLSPVAYLICMCLRAVLVAAGVFFVCFGTAGAFFASLPQVLSLYASLQQALSRLRCRMRFGESSPHAFSPFRCRRSVLYLFLSLRQAHVLCFVATCVFAASVPQVFSLFSSPRCERKTKKQMPAPPSSQPRVCLSLGPGTP